MTNEICQIHVMGDGYTSVPVAAYYYKDSYLSLLTYSLT